MCMTEKKARKYLLSQMFVKDIKRFEGLYFTNDKVFELLKVFEKKLVDAYMRGELRKRDYLDFERLYLTPKNRLLQTEFARALLGVMDKEITEHGERIIKEMR